MKKNVMMRLASFLLVAVLISTSAISGTYAKYVTEGSGSDTARVAEWGVEITGMESDLFKDTYAADNTTAGITNAVKASEKVVAPGTKNEDGVTFSLTGIPEVAVRVEFIVTKSDNATADPVDVYLPAGNYTDWTQAPYDQKFAAAEYYPVVYTLVDTADPTNPLATGNLKTIETFLEGKTANFEPGKDLSTVLGGTSGEYKLTWAWAFGDETGVTLKDKEDTLLGNIAAGNDSTVTNASTSIDFAISIVATQID